MIVPLGLSIAALGIAIAFIGATHSAPRPGAVWAFIASPGGASNNVELQARGEDVSFANNVIEARDKQGRVVARIEVLDRNSRPHHLVGTQWFGTPKERAPWEDWTTESPAAP